MSRNPELEATLQAAYDLETSEPSEKNLVSSTARHRAVIDRPYSERSARSGGRCRSGL
jgi:hypothetical protein